MQQFEFVSTIRCLVPSDFVLVSDFDIRISDTPRGQYLRLVCGGGSYLSQTEFQIFWGIPAGTILHGITVYWPSGMVQKVEITAPGSLTLVEPDRSYTSRSPE